MKFNFLGCIGTTRNLENQSQNPHWAICLPAIGLRVQPLQEIWSDFAKFACVTKMLLVHSNMDGFQILKILLVALHRTFWEIEMAKKYPVDFEAAARTPSSRASKRAPT